jgi:hypothetical protein
VGRGGGDVGGGVSVSLPLPASSHVLPPDPPPPPPPAFDGSFSYERPRCLFFLNVCMRVYACVCVYMRVYVTSHVYVCVCVSCGALCAVLLL